MKTPKDPVVSASTAPCLWPKSGSCSCQPKNPNHTFITGAAAQPGPNYAELASVTSATEKPTVSAMPTLANPPKVEEIAWQIYCNMYHFTNNSGLGPQWPNDAVKVWWCDIARVAGPFFTQVSQPPTEMVYEQKVLDQRTGEVGFFAAPVTPVSANGTEPRKDLSFQFDEELNAKLDKALADPHTGIRAASHNGQGPQNWLIFYEDAGLQQQCEIYTDEIAARMRHKNLSLNWNCHLFKQVNVALPAPPSEANGPEK